MSRRQIQKLTIACTSIAGIVQAGLAWWHGDTRAGIVCVLSWFVAVSTAARL